MKKNVIIIGGCGANISSVVFAFKRIGVEARISTDPADFNSASHLVLPGVGSAGGAMQSLRQLGLVEPIRKIRQPLLGICLGMQLLFEGSEEDNAECLGLIPEKIRIFKKDMGLTIPHMGWNQLYFNSADNPLFNGVEAGENVFFVHSYFAPLSEYTIAYTEYGEKVTASVNNKNVWGCQFHPERSGKTGSTILENFLRL